MDDRKIICNRAKCAHCGDIIVSRYVHDYVECSCKKISVDGGTHYLRRSYEKESYVIEMNVFADDPFEEIRQVFVWESRGKDGYSKLVFKPVCEMSNDHITNILTDERLKNKLLNNPILLSIFYKELDYREKNNIIIND